VASAAELSSLCALLRCLRCRGELEVRDGDCRLRCPGCGTQYEIVRGIPRVLDPGHDDAVEQELKQRTGESFGYEWEHFGGLRDAWERNFRDYLRPHRPEDLRGKLVLDVGTGSGRHSLEAHRAGARVVAVDIGHSIKTARRNLPDEVLTVQADAERLPFAPGTFDFVMSIGVLHHLRDPQRAFRSLVPLARPGGFVHVYLYWQPPSRWHRWVLRGVAAVRRLTTRLPHRVLHLACYPLAAALFVVFVLPQRLARGGPLAAGLERALPLSAYVDYPFGVLVNDQFDRFSAPLEHRYTEDEVRTLFESGGLEEITVLANNGWIASGRRSRDG
jgi:SAM-dependent methyltransferase